MPVSKRPPWTQAGKDFARYLKEEEERERCDKEAQRRAALEKFAAGFRRSRKGNLWCRVMHESAYGPHEMTLTVFPSKNSGFDICVADRDGPRFIYGGFATDRKALELLFDTLSASGPMVPSPCR
jgi:hypothetical protein